MEFYFNSEVFNELLDKLEENYEGISECKTDSCEISRFETLSISNLGNELSFELLQKPSGKYKKSDYGRFFRIVATIRYLLRNSKSKEKMQLFSNKPFVYNLEEVLINGRWKLIANITFNEEIKIHPLILAELILVRNDLLYDDYIESHTMYVSTPYKPIEYEYDLKFDNISSNTLSLTDYGKQIFDLKLDGNGNLQISYDMSNIVILHNISRIKQIIFNNIDDYIEYEEFPLTITEYDNKLHNVDEIKGHSPFVKHIINGEFPLTVYEDDNKLILHNVDEIKRHSAFIKHIINDLQELKFI